MENITKIDVSSVFVYKYFRKNIELYLTHVSGSIHKCGGFLHYYFSVIYFAMLEIIE